MATFPSGWQDNIGQKWNAATANLVAQLFLERYIKPATGIPKTDLDASVQTALDTATQGGYIKPGSGIPETDLAASVQTALARSGLINVRDPVYGAIGDGVADDSAAFLAAFAEAASHSIATYTPERRGTRSIYVPPGTYLINQPEKLMADLSVAAMRGIKWLGAGRDVTFLVFSPSTANQYMLRNANDFLFLTFEDMTFHSTVATASFMLSDAAGGSQNYVFNRVNWSGTWKYGLDLTGSNNNSEFTWFHCGIYGNWTSFLHVGASSTSDQFLNYNFFACQNEISTGDFIDMAKGGNINVWGGSLIHIGSGTETSSAAQCFFRLRGGSHSAGVARLLVSGVRVEHRHNNSSLIKCEWTRGNVTFLSCDTESFQPLLATPTSVVQAEFGISNGYAPEVVFDSCTLMGKHVYHFDGGTYNARPQIEYRACEIVTYLKASDFVVFTNNDATANTSGSPAVRFRGCRGNGTDYKENFDCTVGWPTAVNLVVEPKVLSVQFPFGGLPFSSATTWNANLPLNAVITRVRAFKAASGTSTSTTWTYTLTDADGVQIAQVAKGTAWNAGWSYDSGQIFYRCTTDNKRKLTLTSANITENKPDTFLLIDYLA